MCQASDKHRLRFQGAFKYVMTHQIRRSSCRNGFFFFFFLICTQQKIPSLYHYLWKISHFLPVSSVHRIMWVENKANCAEYHILISPSKLCNCGYGPGAAPPCAHPALKLLEGESFVLTKPHIVDAGRLESMRWVWGGGHMQYIPKYTHDRGHVAIMCCADSANVCPFECSTAE